MVISKHVGFCIYCGAEPVSDEHWLPRWLGGEELLAQASCKICQDKINKYIENPMSRGPFWSARRYLGFRSHSKSKDPLPITLITNGIERIVRVSEQDNPAMLVLISFPEPSIFSQEVPKCRTGIQQLTISTRVFDEKRLQAFSKRYPSDSLTFGFIFVEALPRLLAKIALGAAIMEFGYEAFRPLVRDFIMTGGKDNAEFYVGGSGGPAPKGGSNEFAHEIGFEWVTIRSQEYLQAHIQLFAPFEMPIYFVIVGSSPNWTSDDDIASAWNISLEQLQSIRSPTKNRNATPAHITPTSAVVIEGMLACRERQS